MISTPEGIAVLGMGHGRGARLTEMENGGHTEYVDMFLQCADDRQWQRPVRRRPSLEKKASMFEGRKLAAAWKVWESKQRMAPPRKANQWLASLALEGESVRQLRAREMVERWDTGSLSVDRFSLLEATMGEKQLPKNERALQNLTNRVSASLESMKDMESSVRKKARNEVLENIKERSQAKLWKGTIDGHKSALRAYARFCAAQGERDERIHYDPAVPGSAEAARRRLLMYLEYLYSGGIKFKDDSRCLKSCRRYAIRRHTDLR